MSRSAHREIVDALNRLRSGASTLTSEQYVTLLDAIEYASSVLHLAPRGSDPVATGVWYHHERGPALARLADALHPDRAAETSEEPHDAGGAPTAQAQGHHAASVQEDAAVIRALQQSLQNP